jgi:hypothetical protein
MLVLTGGNTTTFFEDPAHMGIPHATVIQLQQEGIIIVDDIADFEKETIEQIAAKLRRPAGRVPDPNGPANATMSQTRLVTAAIRYYATVGRNLTLSNIMWNTVVKNFSGQWKALEEKKKGDQPDVPLITKALPVIKWTEAFTDYLYRCVGTRTIPLAYVVHSDPIVPAIRG